MTDVDRPWVASYDEWVDPDLPIPDVSYVALLERTFGDFPDRPAYHFLGVSHTFGDLDRYAQRFAGFLADIGCGPGDVVGICLPNTPQYLIALVGALRSGCAVTGVSPLLSPRELAHQLEDCGARVLVMLDAGFEQKFLEVQDRAPHLSHVVVTNIADPLPRFKRLLGRALGKIPTGRIAAVPGKTVIPFMDLLRTYPARPPCLGAKPEDTCMIMYTGGTTGLPKGAELTHRNLVAIIHQSVNWLDADRDEKVYCSGFPFFHIAGAGIGMWALALGCTQILIPDPRNTRHICREMARYRPTYMVNVPSLYQLLLDDPAFRSLDAPAFEQLKYCGSGAAPFSPDLVQALQDVVGEGKVSELYNKPAETDHALREFQGTRWLFTGDVGRMDEDGYLYIVDRAKDMIIVGGFKVFSRESEEILYEHPAVEYCAVVAVPDPERPGSERVKAVIQPTSQYAGRDTAELQDQILGYCRQNMAPYKVPKVIEFVDQMPLTAIGKVDKKALR